ncbi:sodium:solute symporter family transporter [Tautonia rosea]|uniref:sodium:solute symporter family transporter n=1 Tax=Tautonia rosea TaxID=2728037 RepID=UPI0014743EB2|nr:sodium transporter [Tautonia rosea]
MQGTGSVHWIDYSIIILFIVYAIRNGIKSKSVASKNVEEYFLAGRTLPGWKAGLSMAATQFAADTPLLVAGMIAVSGIFSLWRLWIYGVAFLVLGFILAGSWQRAGVITDAELTELRYGKKPAAALRGFKAIYFGTVFNCTVLAMVLLASTRIAEPFLTWNEWLPAVLFDPVVGFMEWLQLDLSTLKPGDPDLYVRSANNLLSILAILLVTLGYSATGGLRSVVATDAVQLGLALVATGAFAYMVIREVGGLGAIQSGIQEKFGGGLGPGGISASEILAFTPSGAREASLALLVVYATQWFFQINADGTGYLAQRTMACRSPRDARVAALTLTTVQIFLRSLLWLPIGLGLMLILPTEMEGDGGVGAQRPGVVKVNAEAEDTELRPLVEPKEAAAQRLDAENDARAQIKEDREFAYVEGFKQMLPMGLLGLMLTGMLAALASTVDTHLNWGSSYWTNDLYKRFLSRRLFQRDPEPRELVWVARGSNVAILVIALVIMTQMPSIRDAWQASLLLGAGIGPLLLLRWLWWRVNAWGEIAATVASLALTAPLLLLVRTNDPDLEVWIEAVRMLIMAVVASGIGIGVALYVGPESRESLGEFYRRTRPPGFWGPIAEANGGSARDDRLRLYRGVGAVIAAALSIFSMLVGIGSLICGSPPPFWWPHRPTWIGFCLVMGFGLMPVWYWLGFSEASAEPKSPPPEDPDRSEAAELQVGAKLDEPDGTRRGDYEASNQNGPDQPSVSSIPDSSMKEPSAPPEDSQDSKSPRTSD